MTINPRFAWGREEKSPTVEELVDASLKAAYRFVGDNPYSALMAAISSLGIFNQDITAKAFSLLTERLKAQGHAETSVTALHNITGEQLALAL